MKRLRIRSFVLNIGNHDSNGRPNSSKAIYGFIVPILCALATACDSSSDTREPTVSDGKDVFVNMIAEKYGEGTASVAAFNELDSESIVYGNFLYYVLKYEAVVEFPEGVKVALEYKTDDDKFLFQTSAMPKIVNQQTMVFSGKGRITFYLNEEGWHAPDGDIYSVIPN